MFENATEAPPTAEEALPITYQAPDWERSLEAFLVEKQNHSGSPRTRAEYYRILRWFFSTTGKTPDQVTPQDCFGFSYGAGPEGKMPSAATTCLRLTVLSSLFQFLARMDLLVANPTLKCKRPKIQPSPPKGLDAGEIKRLLAAIPRTPAGIRDKSIVLFCLYTGRRRSEVLGLRAGDLSRNGCVFYSYKRKGGEVRTRQLPDPVFAAVLEGLEACGRSLEHMAPEEPLFDVSVHAAYLNFRRYCRNAKLPEAGLHVLRHSAAKLRRTAGESLESVSSFLDHSSLAVTSVYLRRLEGDRDAGWEGVSALLQ